MKTMPNTIKWIVIISIGYAALLLGLVLAGFIEFPNASYILLSILTGLVAWVLTHGLASWLDRENREKLDKVLYLVDGHVNQGFPPHKDDTIKILDMVQNKYLSLAAMAREKLGSKFFADLLENACHVKISGIANTDLINDLCADGNHNLINSLVNDREIVVEILLAHPESDFARLRDTKEKRITGRDEPCSNDIRTNIDRLEELVQRYETTQLPGNNRMQIRLSCAPLCSIITYVKKTQPEKKKTLLMGFIFHHALGKTTPFYQIPRDPNVSDATNLFQDCLNHFDELFRDAESFTVFLWDKGGAQLNRHILKTRCVDGQA